jgi:hypothetical protein
VLLRIGKKRHTSSEVIPSEFCDAEFQDYETGGLDRTISVYGVETPALVQAHTEHFAGAGLDPKGRPDFDLEGLSVAVVSDPLGDWPFATTATAHHEIRCRSDQEVKDLASWLFIALRERTREVTTVQMRAYVRAAVAAGDPEWTAYLDLAGVKPSWRTLAGLK